MSNEIYDDLDELPAPPRKTIPAADLELLMLAARAINADFEEVEGEGYANLHFPDGSTIHGWNPLMFHGDALELAVRLRMEIGFESGDVVFADSTCSEPLGDDPTAATCRAIVRAAAEIIRAKKFLNEIS